MARNRCGIVGSCSEASFRVARSRSRQSVSSAGYRLWRRVDERPVGARSAGRENRRLRSLACPCPTCARPPCRSSDRSNRARRCDNRRRHGGTLRPAHFASWSDVFRGTRRCFPQFAGRNDTGSNPGLLMFSGLAVQSLGVGASVGRGGPVAATAGQRGGRICLRRNLLCSANPGIGRLEQRRGALGAVSLCRRRGPGSGRAGARVSF